MFFVRNSIFFVKNQPTTIGARNKMRFTARCVLTLRQANVLAELPRGSRLDYHKIENSKILVFHRRRFLLIFVLLIPHPHDFLQQFDWKFPGSFVPVHAQHPRNFRTLPRLHFRSGTKFSQINYYQIKSLLIRVAFSIFFSIFNHISSNFQNN